MPRNLLTTVDAAGRDVVVPTTTPASIVTVGELVLANVGMGNVASVVRVAVIEVVFMMNVE